MFERFTESAIKVIMLAQEEARRLGHNFVGTEQILLGLIGEGRGIASRCLKEKGVTLAVARTETEKIIGRGTCFVTVEIPFTPRAKRALEKSWEAAKELGTPFIGTEHLLLGLLRTEGAVSERVLENLNVDKTALETNCRFLVDYSPLEQSNASKFNLRSWILDLIGFRKPVFSETSEALLDRARTLAQRRGRAYAGTEHFLLALLETDDGNLQALFNQVSLSKESFEEQGSDLLGQDFNEVIPIPVQFSPKLDGVMSNSRQIAREYHSLTIEPLHILVAFLDEDNCAAITILRQMKVSTHAMRDLVSKRLNG